MQTYYKKLLGKQQLGRQQLDPKVIATSNTLIVEQQLKLCAPFTDQEIKSVMFSIQIQSLQAQMGLVVVSLKPLRK